MVSDAKVAILMVRRDELGRMTVVDGNGKERAAGTPEELLAAVNGVLDDPEIPEAEQVANLEHAAEKIVGQAFATFLPEVAKPLAEPLVRDLVGVVRNVYDTHAERRRERQSKPPRPPSHVRQAERRAARMRASKMRLGASVKRKEGAA